MDAGGTSFEACRVLRSILIIIIIVILLYLALHITTSIVAGTVAQCRRVYEWQVTSMTVLIDRTVPILSSPEAHCPNRLWVWGMLEDR